MYVFCVKVTQLHLMLCDLIDYTFHGIFQARILEWVSFPFSMGSSQPRDWTQVPPHCRQVLYQLSHKGSPRILEWVVYPFSSGTSWLRNQTGVSYIEGDSLPTILLEPNRYNKKNIIPKAVEFIFFSSEHSTFSRIHYMLGHETILKI